jgi:hypothetical protein
MPQPPVYRSQVLDHLGLVAGMFDELGLGDVIDQATQQNPAMRDLTRAWRCWGYAPNSGRMTGIIPPPRKSGGALPCV